MDTSIIFTRHYINMDILVVQNLVSINCMNTSRNESDLEFKLTPYIHQVFAILYLPKGKLYKKRTIFLRTPYKGQSV